MQSSDFFKNEKELIEKVASLFGIQPKELDDIIGENIIMHLVAQAKIELQQNRELSKSLGHIHGLIQLKMEINDLWKRAFRSGVSISKEVEDKNISFNLKFNDLCSELVKFEKNPSAKRTADNLVILPDDLAKRKTDLCNMGVELKQAYEALLNKSNESVNCYNPCRFM